MSNDSPSGATSSYSSDPALYIYTSLTAGSSHIVTATSRLETILRANRVPFKAIDTATDEKARMLWGRRAGKDESGRTRKLPGLVQMGMVLGDLVEIEEWNEYGELKQHVTIYYDEFTQPSISQVPELPPPLKKGPVGATATAMTTSVPATTIATTIATAATAATGADVDAPVPVPATAPAPSPPPAKVADAAATTTLPIRSIAEEAAQKAKQVRLQALREKVHGKGGATQDGAAGETDPAVDVGTESADAEREQDSTRPTGLQSPTTGAWPADVRDVEALRATVQSPTSTSWRPTDVDGPITVLHGAMVRSASAEEIAAVEKEQMIAEADEEDGEEGKGEAETGKDEARSDGMDEKK